MENREFTHIAGVRDGSIIEFPDDWAMYMKVCNRYDGRGGVVRLRDGEYIPSGGLNACGLGMLCRVLAKSLDDYLREEDE